MNNELIKWFKQQINDINEQTSEFNPYDITLNELKEWVKYTKYENIEIEELTISFLKAIK